MRYARTYTASSALTAVLFRDRSDREIYRKIDRKHTQRSNSNLQRYSVRSLAQHEILSHLDHRAVSATQRGYSSGLRIGNLRENVPNQSLNEVAAELLRQETKTKKSSREEYISVSENIEKLVLQSW